MEKRAGSGIFYCVSHFNVADSGGAKPRFQEFFVYKSRHTYLGQDLTQNLHDRFAMVRLQPLSSRNIEPVGIKSQ